MTRRRARRRVSLYVVHRWLGAIAALLVLVVATTGLVLNHAADWGLDRRPVRVGILLDAYGIDMPQPAFAARIGERWLSVVDGMVYTDTRAIAEIGAPAGVARLPPLVLVVGDRGALLLDERGELIERLEIGSWPAPVRRVAASSSAFVVATPGGEYEADPDLSIWQRRAPDAAAAADTPGEALPPGLAQQLRAEARARVLTWERVLLDLHSGRLPGRAGVIAADLLALALIGLALSGLALWIRFLRRQRAHRSAAERRHPG